MQLGKPSTAVSVGWASSRMLCPPSRPSLSPDDIPEDKRALLSSLTDDKGKAPVRETEKKDSKEQNNKKKKKKGKAASPGAVGAETAAAPRDRTIAAAGAKKKVGAKTRTAVKKKKKKARARSADDDQEDEEEDEGEGEGVDDDGGEATGQRGRAEAPVACVVQAYAQKRRELKDLVDDHNSKRRGGPKHTINIVRLCIEVLQLWYHITAVMDEEDIPVVSAVPPIFAWRTPLSTQYPRRRSEDTADNEEWSVSAPMELVMLYTNLALCCLFMSEHPNNQVSWGDWINSSLRFIVRANSSQSKWLDTDEARDKPPSCTGVGVSLTLERITLAYLNGMMGEISPSDQPGAVRHGHNEDMGLETLQKIGNVRYTLFKGYERVRLLLEAWRRLYGDPNGKVQADISASEQRALDNVVGAFMCRVAWLTHRSHNETSDVSDNVVKAWHLLRNVLSTYLKTASSLTAVVKAELDRVQNIMTIVPIPIPTTTLNLIDTPSMGLVELEIAALSQPLISVKQFSKTLEDYEWASMSNPATG